MPLKNFNSSSTCQVYYITRARRDVSKSGETRPETCILRSLSMFFFTRHLHVEDAKRITEIKGTAKVFQVFLYHATEHNLRSQAFRSQLLEHLAGNVAVLLLRRSDLPFSGLLSFFVGGCTIELKQKLKCAHEKAVNVFNDCYEDAVLELVKEIKRVQESTIRRKFLVPQTFPVVIGDSVTSLTFGMSVKDVCVESVTKVNGQKRIAVRLVKKSELKSDRREKPKHRANKHDMTKPTETDLVGPLAVKGIELHMRKTVYKDKKFLSSMKDNKEVDQQKNKPCESSIFVSLNEETPIEVRPDAHRCSISDNTMSDTSTLASSDSSAKHTDDAVVPAVEFVSLLQPLAAARQRCKTPAMKSSNQDCNSNNDYQEIQSLSPDDDDFLSHTSRTYAVFIPDRWGNNGEQFIYISFPDESDKIPNHLYDFSLSGHSTPCSLNLSEECLSPVDSPLISGPDEKKTIYPQPCPVYPLETSFPPVDLPVDFAT